MLRKDKNEERRGRKKRMETYGEDREKRRVEGQDMILSEKERSNKEDRERADGGLEKGLEKKKTVVVVK